MIEAFEIGVSLALRDGVSDGIAAAKRDITRVEAAIASGTVSMERLRQAASAAMGAAPVETARQQKAASPKPADSTERSMRSPDSEPDGGRRRPDHVPVAQAVPIVPSDAGSPAPLSVEAKPTSTVAPPGRDASPALPVAPVVVRSFLPPAMPLPAPPKRGLEGNGPAAVAPSAMGGFSRPEHPAGSTPPAPNAAPVVIRMALAAPDVASSASTAPGAAPMPDLVAPAPRLPYAQPQAAAPWQEADARRDDGPEHARAVPSGPSAPFERVRDGSSDGGDVYLDGMLVGRWMSRFLAREAGRASVGPTGFDARRHPLMPGSSVGS